MAQYLATRKLVSLPFVDCGNGIHTLEARAALLWLDHSAISSPSEIFFAFVGDIDEESEICQKKQNQLS